MLPLLITIQNVFFAAGERLKKDEKGATAVEYGLIVGLIAVVIIAAVAALGGSLGDFFDSINTEIETANAGG
ncbi:Flp family type IVb pilin [Kocuria flava]|uniref:Flp family type IVb pilin n=1 Tax=Kocuria flava TaxID=446860 RepID=UPI003F1C51D0